MRQWKATSTGARVAITVVAIALAGVPRAGGQGQPSRKALTIENITGRQTGARQVAISPDGRMVAIAGDTAAGGGIYLSEIASPNAQPKLWLQGNGPVWFPDSKRVLTLTEEARQRPVAFMFPGQGAQYVGMGRELYEKETVYREALRALDVRPEQAVALEDSVNGMRAAQGAGIFCVVVPNEMTRRLSFDNADLRLTSLTEMPLAEVLLRAGRRVNGT